MPEWLDVLDRGLRTGAMFVGKPDSGYYVARAAWCE